MSDKNTARAFWVQAPGRGALVQAPLRPPGADEVLVRTLHSAISRGTETLVFRGEVPLSQAASMRCPFQDGDFPGPVKYGYMNVGVVEKAQGSEGEALVGRTVFCLHPHQDRYVVPVASVTPLPDGVPAGRAVLAANVETAITGVWDGQPAVGDRIVVIGGGVVGLLTAWIAQSLAGTEVTVVDPAPARGPVAGRLGLRWTTDAPVAADADLVFHASGSPDGLRSALGVAGTEARIIELSWYGTRDVTLPLGEAFHVRRLTLRSSQVGRIPPRHAARWSHRRRMELALRLLREPALDALVTGEDPFDRLPDVMKRLATGGQDALCHRIRYDP